MQIPGMNKLSVPDCRACAGMGKIRVPRGPGLIRSSERQPPFGEQNAPGFTWVVCDACSGEGKR